MIKLYNYYRSSTSYRVRIALNYKNIPFEYVPVHLLNNGGEQHSESYRNLNPIGGVPTLVHDQKVISQSMAILEYLDQVFPQNPIFPTEPFLKAKVHQFCDTINCEMHPLQNLRVTQYLEKNVGLSTEQKDNWMKYWMNIGFEALEKLIEPNATQFCFQNTLTAADIFLIPQIFSAKRFNVSIEKFKKINSINEHCLSLDFIKKSHPMSQIDSQ